MNAVVERYSADAREYQRWWAPVLEQTSARLVDYLEWYAGGPPPADMIAVDVGTGTGTLAATMLSRWPSVRVAASDAAQGMVEVARDRLSSSDAARLSVVHGPAHALPLAAGSADLVVSSFVLQLVPDRLAALREGWRLLRPGGVLGYVTWIDREDYDFDPRIEFDEAVLELGIDEPDEGGERVAGDVPSARAAAAQLRRAGFRQAVAREDRLEYDWTLESYLEYKLAYDERALMAALSDEQQEQLARRAQERLAALPASAFEWRPPIVFAAARKPG